MVEAVGTVAPARSFRPSMSMSMIRSMSWKYSRRMPVQGSCLLGGDKVVDARAQVLQHEILLGRCLAFGDLLRPLFDRHLDSERLVDRERDVEKVEAVDAEVVDDMALGLDVLARNVAGFGNDLDHGVERR